MNRNRSNSKSGLQLGSGSHATLPPSRLPPLLQPAALAPKGEKKVQRFAANFTSEIFRDGVRRPTLKALPCQIPHFYSTLLDIRDTDSSSSHMSNIRFEGVFFFFVVVVDFQSATHYINNNKKVDTKDQESLQNG